MEFHSTSGIVRRRASQCSRQRVSATLMLPRKDISGSTDLSAPGGLQSNERKDTKAFPGRFVCPMRRICVLMKANNTANC